MGVNDSDEELDGIARLLAGKRAMMNFIPYNANEGLGFNRSSQRAPRPWPAACAGTASSPGCANRRARTSMAAVVSCGRAPSATTASSRPAGGRAVCPAPGRHQAP